MGIARLNPALMKKVEEMKDNSENGYSLKDKDDEMKTFLTSQLRNVKGLNSGSTKKGDLLG